MLQLRVPALQDSWILIFLKFSFGQNSSINAHTLRLPTLVLMWLDNKLLISASYSVKIDISNCVAWEDLPVFLCYLTTDDRYKYSNDNFTILK